MRQQGFGPNPKTQSSTFSRISRFFRVFFNLIKKWIQQFSSNSLYILHFRPSLICNRPFLPRNPLKDFLYTFTISRERKTAEQRNFIFKLETYHRCDSKILDQIR